MTTDMFNKNLPPLPPEALAQAPAALGAPPQVPVGPQGIESGLQPTPTPQLKMEEGDEQSDLIFQHPDLTEEDRALAKLMMNENQKKIMKRMKKKGSLFAEVEEDKMVKKLDLAIKAVLNHKLGGT